MHTSIALIALVGLAPAETSSPSWLTDYGQAQRRGKEIGKPLAVFLAPGKDGWQKLIRDGKPTDGTLKELHEGYVCVHLDTTTEAGKKWAKAFSMSSGEGIVLSDRDGEMQAFRHEGSLETDRLTSAVERHTGRTVVRTSNYPSESPTRIVTEPTTSYPNTIQGRIEYGSSPRTSSRANCPT